MRGREAKARKRREGETGRRREEGREMARYVVGWVERWQDGVTRVGANGEAKGEGHEEGEMGTEPK